MVLEVKKQRTELDDEEIIWRLHAMIRQYGREDISVWGSADPGVAAKVHGPSHT